MVMILAGWGATDFCRVSKLFVAFYSLRKAALESNYGMGQRPNCRAISSSSRNATSTSKMTVEARTRFRKSALQPGLQTGGPHAKTATVVERSESSPRAC
ncbi:MAG: hypothetical protein CTY31_01825 [Hyphomicrobium sp.]|nr:MAG: hypothetical protein CTY39_00330 [Hyphomicrobium sp.]PPD01528.1 MAG: hypothetical protein CTY31_01825 [Hyphomicrobium sp.]